MRLFLIAASHRGRRFRELAWTCRGPRRDAAECTGPNCPPPRPARAAMIATARRRNRRPRKAAYDRLPASLLGLALALGLLLARPHARMISCRWTPRPSIPDMLKSMYGPWVISRPVRRQEMQCRAEGRADDRRIGDRRRPRLRKDFSRDGRHRRMAPDGELGRSISSTPSARRASASRRRTTPMSPSRRPTASSRSCSRSSRAVATHRLPGIMDDAAAKPKMLVQPRETIRFEPIALDS